MPTKATWVCVNDFESRAAALAAIAEQENTNARKFKIKMEDYITLETMAITDRWVVYEQIID